MLAPTFETTTRLVARALNISAMALLEGLRVGQIDDLAAIVDFRRRHLIDNVREKDADYIQWRYRLGRKDRGLGDMWLLWKDDRLIGMVGTEDMVCLHLGRRIAGVRTMDIMIDQNLQGSGLGVWLNQAMFREGEFTLAVGANKYSVGTVTRLFHALRPIQEWVYPIDLQFFMARRLGSGFLAIFTTKLCSLAVSGWHRFSTLSLKKNLEIRSITRFDESETRRIVPATVNEVFVERSHTYLNYRLFENPRASYKVSGAFLEGRFAGYVAWRPIVRPDGECWLHIVDFWACRKGHAHTLHALLNAVACEAKAAGCSFVSLMQQGVAQRYVLLRAGFFGPRRQSKKIVGLYAIAPTLLTELSVAPWLLTDLSDDVDGT